MVLVMGAAIVHEGRVLAARRTSPPELAGGWELPGGKVEPDEDPREAVVREVAEELGCRIEVTGHLAGEVPIREGYTLRVALAALAEGEPVPREREHDALRWLGADELDEVHWLGPDVPFLAELREILLGARVREGAVATLRALFYEEDDARSVAARLVADGFAAEAVRERLAGEDDDEDHPWAVLTDAPGFVLELLVEQHDGWLDVEHDSASSDAPPPLDLPDAPRRVKGHFRTS